MHYFFFAFFGVLGLCAVLNFIRYLHIILPVLFVLLAIWVIGAWMDWNQRQHDPKIQAEVESFQQTVQAERNLEDRQRAADPMLK